MAEEVEAVEVLDIIEEIGEVLRPERVLRDRSNPMETLTDDAFVKRFRLSKATVSNLVRRFGERLNYPSARNHPVPPVLQILVTLRFFATGSFNMVIGDVDGIHTSTVSRIIKRVSPLIAGLRNECIKFPEIAEEKRLEMRMFHEVANFPGVLGAVDCTHVPIQSPGGDNGEMFRNRKGYFSINVQVVGSANGKIMDVVASWPGSCHDATIFDNSRVCALMEHERTGGVLLGDNGYPLRPYLLTPFLHPQNEAQVRYNSAHISTRNTVERLFGVWKRRCPCLRQTLRTKLDTTLCIIVATAVVHNIAIDTKVDQEVDEDDGQIDEEAVLPQMHGQVQLQGNAVRDAIVASHFS